MNPRGLECAGTWEGKILPLLTDKFLQTAPPFGKAVPRTTF